MHAADQNADANTAAHQTVNATKSEPQAMLDNTAPEEKPLVKSLPELVQEASLDATQSPQISPSKPTITHCEQPPDEKSDVKTEQRCKSEESSANSSSNSSDNSDTSSSDTSDSDSTDSSASDTSDSSDSDDSSTHLPSNDDEVQEVPSSGVEKHNEPSPISTHPTPVDEEDIDTGPLRTKHEKDTDSIQIPKENFQINNEHNLSPVGKITAVMEKAIIIETLGDGLPKRASQNDISNAQALDAGSVLCFKDRTVIGRIFETFGPVTAPFYIVRFNSKEEIAELKHAHVDMEVFFVEQLSQVVHAANVRAKGYDSSNIHDEEVDGNQMDFSDDEAEIAAKNRKKRMNRGEPSDRLPKDNSGRGGRVPRGSPAKRGRGRGDSHGTSHGRPPHTPVGYRGGRDGRGNPRLSRGSHHNATPRHLASPPNAMNMAFYGNMMPMPQAQTPFFGAAPFAPNGNFGAPNWMVGRQMQSPGVAGTNMAPHNMAAQGMHAHGMQGLPMQGMAPMQNVPASIPAMPGVTPPSAMGNMFTPNVMHNMHMNAGRGGPVIGAPNMPQTDGNAQPFRNQPYPHNQMYAGQRGDMSQMYGAQFDMGAHNRATQMNMFHQGATPRLPQTHPPASNNRQSGDRNG